MRNYEVPNLDKRAYGNILVVSPNDIKMFYTNQNRLSFYIKKNLVEQVDENTYRLLFEPNGLGMSSTGNFVHHPRKNICVVTGEDDLTLLSKHHIVPTFFRKYFPEEEKSNYQFLVLITRDKHNYYTTEEHKFFDVIAAKYDVEPYSNFQHSKADTKRLIGIANSLLLYGTKKSAEDRENLILTFKHGTGLEGTVANYKKFIGENLKPRSYRGSKDLQDFGKAVADKITDYREFEIMWLKHFVDTMKPEFLPNDLFNLLQPNL